jgi:hypothetical protein
MGESKFACPVCGQHITADASAAGEKLECPTCFRNIIVPEGSGSNGTKLIISAAHADRPRSTRTTTPSATRQGERRSGARQFGLAIVVAVSMCLGAGAAYFWGKIFSKATPPARQTKSEHSRPSKAPLRIPHPIPKDIKWNLQIAGVEPPKTPAAGNIHGNGFFCDRANLRGEMLNLRQGKNGPTDLELTLRLPVRSSDELSGRAFEITPDQTGPVPTLTLRWWDEERDMMASRDFKNGYALKLVFEQGAGGRMPGRLFVSFPDSEKSVVAGSFEAEYRPGGGGFRPSSKEPPGNR